MPYYQLFYALQVSALDDKPLMSFTNYLIRDIKGLKSGREHRADGRWLSERQSAMTKSLSGGKQVGAGRQQPLPKLAVFLCRRRLSQ